MKYFLTISLVFLGFQSIASANDTVCAGTKLYYRYLQADSGIMRMPATVSIFATLTNGKVLVYSENADALPKYDIEFSDRSDILPAKSGPSIYEVYSAKISLNNSQGKVVVTNEVTCTHTQEFRP